MPFEPRLAEGDGVHCANGGGKNVTGHGNGRCKGPRAVSYLASPRNGAEARGVKKNEPEEHDRARGQR